MKKMFVRTIIVASFALMGAWSAAANLAPPEPRPPEVTTVEAGPSNSERGAYTERAREHMQQWRVKLDRESAKAGSRAARMAASEDLDAAWSKAREASGKLETTGAADWEMAKYSFRKSSDELAATWTKVRAKVK